MPRGGVGVVNIDRCEPHDLRCEPNTLTCEPNTLTCEPNTLTCEPNTLICEPNSLRCEPYIKEIVTPKHTIITIPTLYYKYNFKRLHIIMWKA